MITSNIQVKRINKINTFNYIKNHDNVSMPEIANALRISGPTVLQNVKELIASGLITETGTIASKGGRKARSLDVVANAYFGIGLEIGKRNISIVIANLKGEMVSSEKFKIDFQNKTVYYRQIFEFIEQAIKRSSVEKEKVLGVGISIPGIMDYRNRKISHSHVLRIFDVPFNFITKEIPYDCFFLNDANAAMVAEISGKNPVKGRIYLSLSNGVGGAILGNEQFYGKEDYVLKQLFIGDNWRSAEFGHNTIVPEGKLCYCGKKGCFDAYCNATILSEHTDGKLDIFFLKLSKGDNNLQKIWDEYLYYLAIQVNSLRMIFDSNIIIGGYVGGFMEPYIDDLRSKAAELNTFEPDGNYIKTCNHHYEASALGAAYQQIGNFINRIN